MNRIYVIAAALLAMGCDAGRVKPLVSLPERDLPLLEGVEYRGVVFPGVSEDTVDFMDLPVSEYWTPTRDDISKFDAGLKNALEAAIKNQEELESLISNSHRSREFVRGEIGKILRYLRQYRRQYCGIVTPGGSRRLFVNFFPEPRPEGIFSFPYWRRDFVVVEDGGHWFWRIQYDADEGNYIQFDSGGRA